MPAQSGLWQQAGEPTLGIQLSCIPLLTYLQRTGLSFAFEED